MAQLRRTVLLVASAFLVLRPLASACFGCDPSPFAPDMLFAAGGDSPCASIWNNRQNCGKRFNIQCQGNGCNGHGPVSVKSIDRCPNGCAGGRAFDLPDVAFSTIANLDVGVITVEYSSASSLDGEDDAETFIAEVGRINRTVS